MAKKLLKKSSDLPFTPQVLLTLCASTGISLGLLGIRMAVAGNIRFWFLAWNLLLAWLPLLFALGFRIAIRSHRLMSWQNILLLGLWLGFLPNSFYLMSDLIHVQSSGETSVLYDIAMLMSFILNGLILGYISVYIVHMQLLKRLSVKQTSIFLGLVFLACSFAIYVGRYLRWNTWDLLVNPAGLLLDVTERVINPFLHSQTFIVTGVFFVLISSTYLIIYQLARVLTSNHNLH